MLQEAYILIRRAYRHPRALAVLMVSVVLLVWTIFSSWTARPTGGNPRESQVSLDPDGTFEAPKASLRSQFLPGSISSETQPDQSSTITGTSGLGM